MLLGSPFDLDSGFLVFEIAFAELGEAYLDTD